MGWKDLIAKQDVLDREPTLRDPTMILAYLEELCRLRSRILVRLTKDELLPAVARLESVAEENGTFTLSLQRSVPGEFDRRFPVEMLFPLDGMRFRCTTYFVSRGGYMQVVFKLPDCIYHAERRSQMRARFGRLEKANVTILEDLFQGRGVTGRLVNISLEGLCLRVEKAISIQQDRRLPVNTNLFQNNQQLLVVRILDLPRTPVLECSGRVAHMFETPEGVLMGVRMEGLGGLEADILTQVLGRRLPTFSRGFPRKVRRCEMDLGALEEAERLARLESERGDAAPEDLAELPEEVAAASDPLEGMSARDRLVLVKKRCRRILLVQADDLNRAILAGTLQVDGFRQVKEARNLVEALQCTRNGTFDLILLDQGVGAQGAQTLLERLRKLGHLEEVPVVMIADTCDVKTTIMAKAARIDHVQRVPVDYDGELRAVLHRLLKI
jgi:CheY-like chemotaxis protein